jgi:dihydroorotate dehydrogenase
VALYSLARRLLFRLDAETAHETGLAALRLLQAAPGFAHSLTPRPVPALTQSLFGRSFPNPVGIAAGFDKDARVVRALAALGFGFLEVGTVTPLPQAGNPRPRLFRHPEAESLQNALGFNNAGMEAMAGRLAHLHPFALPLGVNVGKNKATPQGAALGDYERLIARLHPLCDYLVVNLSSPNTPGLRDLQNEAFIKTLLKNAVAITAKPVLVKISPDLATTDAVTLAQVAVDAGAAGIVATNTSADYGLVPGAAPVGGLSGRAIRDKSFAVFAAIARALYGKAVLISVGGIDSGAEAYRRLKAGASLVQLYTAFVYRGPGLPRRITRELLELLERDGAQSIAEVVGAERR